MSYDARGREIGRNALHTASQNTELRAGESGTIELTVTDGRHTGKASVGIR